MYIKIYKRCFSNRCEISSSSNIFKNEFLIFNIEGDCIYISVPDIDYLGKQQKTGKGYKNYRKINVTTDYLFKEKKYIIDTEDSTEDKIVIYLNN